MQQKINTNKIFNIQTIKLSVRGAAVLPIFKTSAKNGFFST
jgi:hypothetical protein